MRSLILNVFDMRASVRKVSGTSRLPTGWKGTRETLPSPLIVLVAKSVVPATVGSVVEETPPMVELIGNEEANVEMKDNCQPLTRLRSIQLVPCVNFGLTIPTRISLWR